MGTDISKSVQRLDVEADLSGLPVVIRFVEDRLCGLRISEKEHSQILIVVEELFVNIASYAYGADTGMVSIVSEASKDENSITLTFIDEGIAFNPLEHKDPDITLKGEDRQQGGLGIFYVKKKVDSMTYTYEDGKNRLQIKKTFVG